jgi:hypothetical protein
MEEGREREVDKNKIKLKRVEKENSCEWKERVRSWIQIKIAGEKEGLRKRKINIQSQKKVDRGKDWVER